MPAHLRPLLTFYYWTGWRSNEALSLEIRQVNLDDGIVSLDPSQSKNNHARVFYFGALDELRDVLTKQVASAKRLTRDTSSFATRVFHEPGAASKMLQAFATSKPKDTKKQAQVRQFKRRSTSAQC